MEEIIDDIGNTNNETMVARQWLLSHQMGCPKKSTKGAKTQRHLVRRCGHGWSLQVVGRGGVTVGRRTWSGESCPPLLFKLHFGTLALKEHERRLGGWGAGGQMGYLVTVILFQLDADGVVESVAAVARSFGEKFVAEVVVVVVGGGRGDVVVFEDQGGVKGMHFYSIDCQIIAVTL